MIAPFATPGCAPQAKYPGPVTTRGAQHTRCARAVSDDCLPFATGTNIVAVQEEPMSKPADKKVARTFMMSPETVERMKAAAVEDLRSMNASVELACRRWLAERQNEKGPHHGGPVKL
jgi:hypothetical protein